MKQDRVVGVGILLGGVVLFGQTFFFKELPWEPLGMAFWPRALLAMLGIIAVYLIIRGRLDEGSSEGPNWRAFCALATGVAYILALPVFGFVLLTPPFIFIAVLLLANSLDRRHLLQAALTAAFGTAGVYLVFHVGLEVQLPEGLLN